MMDTRKLMVDGLLEYIGQASDERYVPLEYIESTGTQWIDTLLQDFCDTHTYRVQATMEFLSTGYTGANGVLQLYASPTAIRIQSSGSKIDATGPVTYTAWGEDGRISRLEVNGLSIQHAWQTNYGGPLYIGGLKESKGSVLTVACRVYAYKVYENSTGFLVRDFVPMMRTSSNISGLYDIVENKFYENMGTGQFIPGPAKIPAEYRYVEYITSDQATSTKAKYLILPIVSTEYSKCVVDFRPTSGVECYMGSNYGFAIVARAGNKWFNANATIPYVQGQRVLISQEITNGQKVYKIDGQTAQVTTQSSSYRNNKLFIFALSEQVAGQDKVLTSIWAMTGDCYSVRCWDLAGNLYGWFIPVVRNFDDKPGLYDLCGSICPLTGTPFYVNAGPGEFTWQELT